MTKEIEIRREELIQVTENIVEAFLCDITKDGYYSPARLRAYAEDSRSCLLDPGLKQLLLDFAHKIERLARENMDCTCTPDSTEVCIACKLLS